ncbi:NUDIX domain-containing protein [Nocardioides sp. CBS4Y-1]|uniref:NUDIX domain-containing protein n=2 Tax=Nocardioides acrostichi TaxID=2784339 RepID=A0A930UXU5_9ACTN|nr:NUDIX domain-containing protein [Nocardioides acrostichi]
MRGEGSDTEVLLQLRRHTGYMDDHFACGAAGHVEVGETPHAAARREACEELGVDLEELAFLTVMPRTANGAAIDERVDYFFTSRVWTGEPRVVEPEKSGGIRWCALGALDGLPYPVVPHERAVLEALRDGSSAAYTTFGFEEDA